MENAIANDDIEEVVKKRNAHYVSDLFWNRELRSLSEQQLNNNFGWRTLLLMQFQYQFRLVVLGGVLACAVVTLRDMSFAICNTQNRDLFYEIKLAVLLYIYDVFFFLDIILMFIYKIITWPEVSYLYPSRPGKLLLIELLTIAPWELISRPDRALYYYLRSRYIIRLARVVYILRHSTNISSSSSWLAVYLLFSSLLIFLSFFFCFIVSVIYTIYEKLSLSKTVYYSILVLTAARVTSKGFGEVESLREGHIADYEYNVLVFIHVISFGIFSYQVCKCACRLVPKMKYEFTFAHRFADAKKRLEEWKKLSVVDYKNYHRVYEKTIINNFKMTWYHNKSSPLRFVPGYKIPNIIIKEIALDICWDAFKHSHLFKKVDVPVLRSLSIFMERNVYYKGEIIVKKNKTKSCMIYVISGIIQILSEENSETPIMSLTSGSCIGESTLFVDYRSTCTVIANSYTEVYILKRKRMVRIWNLYPDVYRKLGKTVMARYNKARRYHRAFQIQKVRHRSKDDVDFLPVLYIIMTIRRFMEPNRVITRRDQMLANSLKGFVFCADYLDMLAIPDELQLVSDSVFVSKKFPIIFQPHSVFLDIWNFIMGLIACMLVCVYPVAVCTMIGDEFTAQIMTYILVISVIWVIDIYIRISTAVKTKHAFYTKISDIVYYRLSTLGFLADIICILPVGPILYSVNTQIFGNVLLLLEIHKLLKAYRINGMMKKISELNTKRMSTLNFVRVIVTLFILFYYTACVLHLLLCRNGCSADLLEKLEKFYNIQPDDTFHRFVQMYTATSYFISDSTLFSFLQLMPYYMYVVILGLQVLYCCIYICVQSFVISTEVVNNQEKHEFRECVSNICVMLKKVKFPQEMGKQVFEFLKKQYYLDEGSSFLYEDSLSTVVTKNLRILSSYVMYGKYINEITIFANLEDHLVIEIARRCNVSIYLAGETVTYAGEVCRYMYLILHGYCKVVYRDGRQKMITVKDCISAYELCMDIPHINTVIAYTDCKLLSLSSSDFWKILRSNRKLAEDIEIACKQHEHKRIINKLLDYEVVKRTCITKPKGKSFIFFKYTKKKSDNLDYHLGFPKLWVVMKCILMRVTITPDGKFLIIWEFFRCIFAFSTNMLSTVAGLYDAHSITYAMIFFDVTAWVDIYVMHHACFYNDVGLLIYHPLSTAKYYWNHRFIIDIIGSVPFDYLFKNHHLFIYFRLNRLLQLYRMVMFLKFFDMSQLSRKHLFDIIKYFPLTLLVIFYISSIILYNACFSNGIKPEYVGLCAAGDLIDKRMVNETYTPINALTSYLLLTVTAFAMINTTKIRFKLPIELFMYSVVTLIGTGFSLWLTSKMVANNFFRNIDLTSYQQDMRDLLTFYSFRKIDKNIKKELIKHFEFMWLKKSGKNVVQLMNPFKPCFREDVLFSKFGGCLTATSVFFNAPTSFFKSILVKMLHKVYLKRAIIYRVNDIIDDIYIIVNGEVEILGSDYKTLTVLKEGSIFGSLTNEEFSRQLLSAISKSNLEVLIIKSRVFYEILKNYSGLSNYFRRMTIGNMDYLENEFTIPESEKTVSIVLQKRKKTFYDFYFKCSPLIKNYERIKVVDNILLVVSCLVGFHYECYQKAVLATDSWSLALLYIFDVLFLFRMYLKLHTVIVNAYGIPVYDKREIMRNYVKDRPGFYFDVATGAPIDLVSYFFVWSDYFPVILNCMRVNRLLRVYLFVKLLQTTQEKLHINVATIRLIYVLTLTFIYIQVMGVAFFYTRFDTIHLDASIATRPKFYKNCVYVVAYTTIGAPVIHFNIKFTLKVSLHCVIITMLGRFIITLFIAEMCATLEAINKSKNNFKDFAVGLKNYMKSHDVSLPLNDEILEYVNLLWINYRGVLNPTLFARTPYYLKEATFNSMFGYHLRRHPLIKMFHVDLIRQMAGQMEVIIFFPGNHIVYEGDVDQTMYFLHDGIVDALTEDTLEAETVALSLESGDSFGLEQGLFPNTPHMYTYKVRRPTVLVALKRISWHHLLSFFPASVEILNLYYTDPIDTYDENIKNYLN